MISRNAHDIRRNSMKRKTSISRRTNRLHVFDGLPSWLKLISGVDPFTESCTMVQTCSKVWRKNYMPEDCIAIIPPEGYPNQKNYSIKAVRWIQSEAKKKKIEIRHALNGGEEKICGHYVDGYHQDNLCVLRMLLARMPNTFSRQIQDQSTQL